jgi:acyl-CoA synthetase (AMP-forming)/AMP-acid ligase II
MRCARDNASSTCGHGLQAERGATQPGTRKADVVQDAWAFRGAYLSVGDMARRDAYGFYILVDRKNNMIISGGENAYPSEVENAFGGHSKVQDVAVIGRSDAKWGEIPHAPSERWVRVASLEMPASLRVPAVPRCASPPQG